MGAAALGAVELGPGALTAAAAGAGAWIGAGVGGGVCTIGGAAGLGGGAEGAGADGAGALVAGRGAGRSLTLDDICRAAGLSGWLYVSGSSGRLRTTRCSGDGASAGAAAAGTMTSGSSATGASGSGAGAGAGAGTTGTGAGSTAAGSSISGSATATAAGSVAPAFFVVFAAAFTGFAGFSSTGCSARISPSRSARRRTRSACASSMLDEWLFTPIPSATARSSVSLLVIPSSLASSWRRIFAGKGAVSLSDAEM